MIRFSLVMNKKLYSDINRLLADLKRKNDRRIIDRVTEVVLEGIEARSEREARS
jgi:hypothetical protein